MLELLGGSGYWMLFALTYIVHSTLIVGLGAAFVCALGRRLRPDLHAVIWKLTLVLPLATSLAISVADVPHFGPQLPVVFTSTIRDPSPSHAPPLHTDAKLLASQKTSMTRVLPEGRQDDLTSTSKKLDQPSVRAPKTSGPGAADRRTSQAAWVKAMTAVWLALAAWGVGRLLLLHARVSRLRREASPIADQWLTELATLLRERLGIRRRVELLSSSDAQGPLTAGIARPFILLRQDQLPPAAKDEGSSEAIQASEEWTGLLAHELVHVRRHDAAWNLWIQLLSKLLPFQPLNGFAGRRLRQEMDFIADSHAAAATGDRGGLARCLVRVGSQSACRDQTEGLELAASMAAFRSTLGRRVEALLDMNNDLAPATRTMRSAAAALMLIASVLAASIAPRAVAKGDAVQTNHHAPPMRLHSMKRPFATLAIMLGLSLPATADEPPKKPQTTPAKATEGSALKSTPDPLPEGIQHFNGMLVGRLAAKDVERGEFVVKVDAAPRVWRNSRAENPKSVVGKTISVSGVSGKWLDVLVITRVGETLEFECKHDGDGLVFPGELLRKTAAFNPADYPVLPDEFRGFRGAVVGKIVKKDASTFELIIKAERVTKTWDRNDAERPEAVVGKPFTLIGFWNRKDAYHQLKEGDRVEAGMQHLQRQSDHLNLVEFVRKVGADDSAAVKPSNAGSDETMKRGSRGFRGMLVGRLVEKDVERGTFTITVDAVPRVWNKNRAPNPKSLVGAKVAAAGVAGPLLDVLVVTRVGETLQFGAFAEEDGRMRVVEVLRKAAAVKPGDYPELPAAARGFKGLVVAKVVKKDQHIYGLTVEVQEVKRSFPGSRAQEAEQLAGRKAMLAGFWKHKDFYHQLKVGDRIECGLEHPQPLSDHLSVIETLKKLDR